MPSPLVRTKKDEELWERAKEIVSQQYGKKVKEGSPRYYKLVTSIYLRMKYGLGGAPREKVREALQEIKEERGRLMKEVGRVVCGVLLKQLIHKQLEEDFGRIAEAVDEFESKTGMPILVAAATMALAELGNNLVLPSSDEYEGAIELVVAALGTPAASPAVRMLASHIVGTLEANGWLRPPAA